MTTEKDFLAQFRDLKRTRKTISLTKSFASELEDLNKLLSRTQKERQGNHLFNVPYPYNVGMELEFRYHAFELQQSIIFELVNNYIPIELHNLFLNKIPKSPIMVLQWNVADQINGTKRISTVSKTTS